MDGQNGADNHSPITESKRRRGVQASRNKLRQALVAAGIKTQAELAEKMADLEGIETPPRGLVNKVFRGESVDTLSIERIAKALGLEGWQLYRTADETADDPLVMPLVNGSEESSRPATANRSENATNVSAPSPRKNISLNRWIVAACAVAAVIGAVVMWRITSDWSSPQNSKSIPGRSALVVPFKGERGSEFAAMMETALTPRWTLLAGVAQTLGNVQDAQAERNARNVDVLITGETRRTSRHIALRLFLHTEGSMQHVWTEVVPAYASADYVQRRMQRAALATGLGNEPAAALSFPSIQAEERLLIGRQFLDKARSEKNMLRALVELQSAISLAPDYGVAHAYLCEALIAESVRTGNVARLDEAQPMCNRALELDSTSVDSIRAQAYLLRKRGNTDEAIALGNQALELDSNNVDTMLLLAELHLLKFSNSNTPESQQTALSLLHKAAEIDPEFWKTPFTIARIHYSGGNVDEAIKFQVTAAKLHPSHQTLGNLGAYYFCRGSFAAAREAFLETKNLDAAEYIGDAQIASVDYQMRDYARAVAGFRKALETHQSAGDPNEYRLWGNLGDALRLSGDRAQAITAYEHAIELVEQMVAKGDQSPVQRAYRVLYYVSMGQLQANYLNTTLRASLLKEMQELEASPDPVVLLAVAGSYMYLADKAKAAVIRDHAVGSCPGFGALPEFDLLKK